MIRIGSPRTRRPGNANPVTMGIIFAIIGGAIFIFFALPPLQYAAASKSWPAVPGTITRSEVKVWQRDGNTHYEPDIAYSYMVEGKRYSSSKITVGDGSLDNNVKRAKSLQAEYPAGKEVDVYYDPDLPESAVLQPGTKSGDLMLAGISALFFFVGLLAVYQGVKAKRRAAEAKNATMNQ
ncbi:MAG: DUF3592 domain-containing protein [Bacteroidales bacterium]|nr:DUF3592 domain-containing protein [Bacteroidales bacterium]